MESPIKKKRLNLIFLESLLVLLITFGVLEAKTAQHRATIFSHNNLMHQWDMPFGVPMSVSPLHLVA